MSAVPQVPDTFDYQPPLGARFATGAWAVKLAQEMPAGLTVALDTETPNTTDSFTIKCVTAAWQAGGRTVAVCLDPLRRPDHAQAVRQICDRAARLVFHKSDFDVPGMAAAGLLSPGHMARVYDTLIYARMAWSDTLIRKRLEDLGPRILGTPLLAGGLKYAIRAAGFRSDAEWFAKADIDIPFYRFNAMADTVVTLRLLEPLQRAASDRQLDHPFARRGCTTRAEADALAEIPQAANRILLRREIAGLAVDLEYLDRYRETVDAEMLRQSAELAEYKIRAGNGQDLVTYLDREGLLPEGWKRTKTGKLSATKEDLDLLHHPLAAVHRAYKHADRVLGYLEKVVARSAITGRLHPQYAVLGASATGRSSMAEPEIHQFPAEARPIILEDAAGVGVTSVDWSSIEPALLAWAADDIDFIEPFELGADIYEPIQRVAGISRSQAKVVSLAVRYGMGLFKMALSLNTTEDDAAQIKRRMFAAMPGCARLMGKLTQIADDTGVIPTIGGRILTVPRINGKVAAHKAVNYFCQGSNADLLYSSIIAADAAGLGDDIMITMHDEIVCTTGAGPEIERLMQTPPDYFTRWTPRTPTIRTDRQDLGHCWKKC